MLWLCDSIPHCETYGGRPHLSVVRERTVSNPLLFANFTRAACIRRYGPSQQSFKNLHAILWICQMDPRALTRCHMRVSVYMSPYTIGQCRMWSIHRTVQRFRQEPFPHPTCSPSLLLPLQARAEVKFLERALHERDFSTADTASEIATLRAMFAKRSTKSDLERLAKKGSGGGGGGGADLGDSGSESGSDASDKRRKRNKKKREKAKERKRHAKDGESNGRTVGGSRDARRDGDGSGGGGGGSSSRSAPSSSGGKRRDAGGGGKSSKSKGKRAATPRHGSGSDDDEAGFE